MLHSLRYGHSHFGLMCPMINRKKTQRLYVEEGLAVRRRRSRRRAVGTRAPAPVPALPNHLSGEKLPVRRSHRRPRRILDMIESQP